jgi:hypothetical protein
MTLPVGELNPAVAEGVLPAHVQRKILPHLCPVPLEKRNEAAKVVEVPVADDQRVKGGAVDLEDIEVVKQGSWREPEVEEEVPLLASPLGLQVKREAVLVVEVLREACPEDDPDSLNLQRANFCGPDQRIVVSVHDYPDREAIHGRGRTGFRLRQPSSRTPDGHAQ